MSIQKNLSVEQVSFIKSPGEYRVTVKDLKTTTSKKGKDQLVASLATDDGKTINHYFNLDGAGPEHFARFAEACGVSSRKLSAYIGKRLGILVLAGQPNKDGKIYMRVEGVGPEADVTEQPPFEGTFGTESSSYHDEVPF